MSDTSRSDGGSGLGLSYVSAIVKSHQGEVNLKSTPGLGSVFTLKFPAS